MRRDMLGMRRAEDAWQHRQDWFGWFFRLLDNELTQINGCLVVLLVLVVAVMSFWVGLYGALTLLGSGLMLLACLNLAALLMAWMIYSIR